MMRLKHQRRFPPPAHLYMYIAIFELVRPFDHRMTPWKCPQDIFNGPGVIMLTDKQTDKHTKFKNIHVCEQYHRRCAGVDKDCVVMQVRWTFRVVGLVQGTVYRWCFMSTRTIISTPYHCLPGSGYVNRETGLGLLLPTALLRFSLVLWKFSAYRHHHHHHHPHCD